MAQQFKLQALLKYRCSLEEQAQLQMARTQGELNACQGEQQQVQQRITQLQFDLQRRQGEGLVAAEMGLFEDALRGYAVQLEHISLKCEQLEQQLKQNRLDLMEAMKRRKMIEKLKENQQEAYLKSLNAREREMLDEISLQQNRRGGPQ